SALGRTGSGQWRLFVPRRCRSPEPCASRPPIPGDRFAWPVTGCLGQDQKAAEPDISIERLMAMVEAIPASRPIGRSRCCIEPASCESGEPEISDVALNRPCAPGNCAAALVTLRGLVDQIGSAAGERHGVPAKGGRRL